MLQVMMIDKKLEALRFSATESHILYHTDTHFLYLSVYYIHLEMQFLYVQ